MSDARWFEVDRDIAAAVKHFSRSVQLFEKGGFGGDAIEAYAAQMAFLHAMQSGHTSLEVALVRILDLMEEQAPTGTDWHADLIRRAVRPFPGRPAILPPEVGKAANETRGFRHVAMRAYETFDVELAVPAVRAARDLVHGLPASIAAFKAAIDPPE